MRIAVASVVGTVALVIAACSSPADAPPPQSAATPPVATSTPAQSPNPQASLLTAPGDPRFVEAGLPLLPDNLPYAVRPLDYVKSAFAFAAQHSEVLRYVPCFCGCERMGHHANDECFVAKRSATGKVTEWQPHGVICEICLDVAHQAMQLHESGATAEQIRRAVDTKWSTATGSHTNTMMPPHSGGH
jgi:hypothetical protein